MLHDNESIAHYKPSNVIIWMSMAFQGGFLNVGGLLACHRFVSHVTGYGTMIPYEFAAHGIRDAASFATVPVFFLLGAMLSGYLVDVRLRLHLRPRYYVSFGIIFVLMSSIYIFANFGFLGSFGEPLDYVRDYVLLSILAFVCGVQNGTITTVSKTVIRTTHLSGITTDLGIGIMRFVYRNRIGPEVANEWKANLMRIGIISFFLIGSLVGFEVFSKWKYDGFLVPLVTSGVLCFVMMYFALVARVRETAGK